MFEINIGTQERKHVIKLSEAEMEQLSVTDRQTIRELINYRSNIGLFPWGYHSLIDGLRKQFHYSALSS